MDHQIFFSSDSNLRDIILSHIDLANESIYVAVAWFTDPIIFDSLFNKLLSGVNVEVIITNHEFNRNSPITYDLLNEEGGFFATCGSDQSTMHNKFCIVDHVCVLNGSFNYTKKANNSNQENLTVVSGDPIYASKFYDEFQKLKELSGHQRVIEKELSIAESIKTLTAIRTFIQIGEVNFIFSFAHKIKGIDRLKEIYDLLMLRDYEKALDSINSFLSSYSQLITIGAFQRDYLKTQIRLISLSILYFESEKIELENKLDAFNHRYTIELHPLTIKILAIKKKINEKLKKRNVYSKEFEEAERLYKEAVAELEEELENFIPELTEDESLELKKLHREAVKYCHPDSSECKIIDTKEAERIFNDLTDAYHRKDLERVKHICIRLRNGESVDMLENISELEILTAKLETLKSKLEVLLQEIHVIKSTEAYSIIASESIDQFFSERKKELEENYKELKAKYSKNEEA